MEISVCVTSACNLCCKYCYQGHKRENIWMSVETAKRVAEKILYLLNVSKDNVLKINYIGGEPLLNCNAIFTICDIIQRNVSLPNVRVEYSMTTNGLMLSDDIVKRLEKYEFVLSLSIDGNMDSNDHNRITNNGEGTYTKIIEAFEKFTHPETICARMTITKREMKNLVKNVEHVYNIGFRRISPVCDFFGEWEKEELLCMEKQHSLLKKWYLEKYPEISIFCFEGRFYDYFYRNGKYCKAGFPYHYSFGADGRIYPCTYVNHMKKFAIDSSNRVPTIDKKVIQEYVKKDEKCVACNIKKFCFGKKCGFLNLEITGSLTIVPMSICHYEKMMYKLVKEIVTELLDINDMRMKLFSQLEIAGGS